MWSYEITFSEVAPANRNRFRRNFTQRRWLRWHWLLAPALNKRQMATKPFYELSLSPKQRIISSTSRLPISVKFQHKTWIGIVINSFRSEFQNFSDKRSLTAFSAQLYALGLAVGLERISALQLIVEALRVFPHAGDFFRTTYCFLCKITPNYVSETTWNFAVYRLALQHADS